MAQLIVGLVRLERLHRSWVPHHACPVPVVDIRPVVPRVARHVLQAMDLQLVQAFVH